MAFGECKTNIKFVDILYAMDFWILIFFSYTYKTHEYGSYNVLVSYYIWILGFCMIDVNKKLMDYKLNLLRYGLFKVSRFSII